MENLIWVLGASGPEMEAIEALLRECCQTVAYARDSRPVDSIDVTSMGQVIDLLCLHGIDVPMWTAWYPLSRFCRAEILEPGLRTHQIGTMSVMLACVAGDTTRQIDLGSIASPDERGTRIVTATLRVPKVMRIVPDNIRMIIEAAI